MSFFRRAAAKIEKASADRTARLADKEEQATQVRIQRLELEAQAREDAARSRLDQILGPDLVALEQPTTPEAAKLAIKMVRLRKKEIQAEKQALASELADVREAWRERQAGRISTLGIGRGLGGQIVRGSIQANRRSKRLTHAATVNEFSDQRQELDEALRTLDLLIVKFERIALS